MYQVISENMSSCGGPMWDQHTTINWEKFFIDIENAKKYCEKKYGKKISWKKSGGSTCSGDLRYIMYTIKKIKLEDAEK